MNKMRIAIFSDTFIPEVNGVATSVKSLFDTLTKFGEEVFVVTTGNNKEVTFEDNILRIPGLELKALYGYRASLPFNKEAFDILSNLSIDVCHINTEFGIGQFGFYFVNKLDIPTVYTYHTMYEDYTYYVTKGYLDRISKWAFREFAKAHILRSTEVIVPSDKTMNYLRSIDIKSYINIVPTGFNFDRFILDNNDKKVEEIKSKYKLYNKKVLLCLGRVAKEKSFDIIINNFKNYLDKYSNENVVLLFVGDGPQLEELKNLSKTLNLDNKIIFVGKVPVNETQYYYHCADLFLSASTSETQGLTFMEAMAAHVPILCRFDNNLLGIIEENYTGFFFVNDDEFIFKLDKILSLNDEELTQIKNNAFNSIDKFNEKNFYDNIVRVYERSIRKKW